MDYEGLYLQDSTFYRCGSNVYGCCWKLKIKNGQKCNLSRVNCKIFKSTRIENEGAKEMVTELNKEETEKGQSEKRKWNKTEKDAKLLLELTTLPSSSSSTCRRSQNLQVRTTGRYNWYFPILTVFSLINGSGLKQDNGQLKTLTY